MNPLDVGFLWKIPFRSLADYRAKSSLHDSLNHRRLHTVILRVRSIKLKSGCILSVDVEYIFLELLLGIFECHTVRS